MWTAFNIINKNNYLLLNISGITEVWMVFCKPWNLFKGRFIKVIFEVGPRKWIFKKYKVLKSWVILISYFYRLMISVILTTSTTQNTNSCLYNSKEILI